MVDYCNTEPEIGVNPIDLAMQFKYAKIEDFTGCVGMLKMLIASGALLTAKVLELAVLYRHDDSVSYLCECDCVVSFVALQLMIRRGNARLFVMLYELSLSQKQLHETQYEELLKFASKLNPRPITIVQFLANHHKSIYETTPGEDFAAQLALDLMER